VSQTYVNAAQVLPPKLLNEVRQHCVGLVYIPVRDDFHKRRAALVARLGGLGVAPKEIAALCGVTRRRVYQILRQQAATAKSGEKVSVDTPEFSW